MRLESKEEIIHLSHFHRYVSAYELDEETLADLEYELQLAVTNARELGKARIVGQGCTEHVFIVFPSGTIGLYREVGSFTIYEEPCQPSE